MKNYFENIKTRLFDTIKIEHIEIVDNSHKHKGHRFYSDKKFHLHLKIRSEYLNTISRVKAQKKIMEILKSDLKSKIHALEISIEK
jgi:BolA family transcriptional regulator, general stress-responsive regulator